MYYINMEPVNIDGMTCLENTMMTYITYKDPDVQKVFIQSWSFNRYDSEELLGRSFGVGEKDIKYLAKTYYGIGYGMFEAQDEQTSLDYIMHELENGNPLAIAIDAYYCPWEHSYHQNHSDVSHFFNIIGCDDEGRFIVSESMPVLKNQVIEKEDLLAGIRGGILYRAGENKKSEEDLKEQMREELIQIISKNEEGKMFESMRKFAEDIRDWKDYESEFAAGNSDWSIPLLQNIGYLYGSRKQFLVLLEYLNENHFRGKMNDVISDFSEAEKNMKSVKMLFYKMRYQDDFTKIIGRIYANLTEAIAFEESAAEKLEDVLRKDQMRVVVSA